MEIMAGGGNSHTDFKDTPRSVALDTLLAFASPDWTFSTKSPRETENKLAS